MRKPIFKSGECLSKKVERIIERYGKVSTQAKAKAVNELKSIYALNDLLKASSLAKSSFYYHLKNTLNKVNQLEQQLKNMIKQIHQQEPCYGYRRVQVALGKLGFSVNLKKVLRLMSELGLQALIRQKKKRFYEKSRNIHKYRII